MQNRIDAIPIETDSLRSTFTLKDKTDDPRSVQTSPTECLYPEQTLTALAKILSKPINKGLYKVRVYLHSLLPESYAAMIESCCEHCGSVKNLEHNQCTKCKESDFLKVACFRLLVQDTSLSEPVLVTCFGGQAKEFVGVNRIKTSFDLQPLSRVVGRWFDMHVLCKVLPDRQVKLTLAHTIIKPD
jgi:hypothetical protein